jgi:AcrR family transcriptional regulator
MSRAQSAVDPIAAHKLVEAAVARFDRHGYQGTSIREIATDAGLTVAAFYEHFPSKQSILVEIIDAAYGAAIAQMEGAVAAAGDDPASRLEAAVWAHCDHNMRYQRSCRIAEKELAQLDAEHRERLLGRRHRLGEILYEIIGDGADRGVFEVREPAATSRALSTMCAAIGSWYDPGGHEVPRQIAQTYCELAGRMAGVGLQGSRETRRLAAVPVPRSA